VVDPFLSMLSQVAPKKPTERDDTNIILKIISMITFKVNVNIFSANGNNPSYRNKFLV
jgi:hypothetical protein